MESPIESLPSDHLTIGISAAVSNLWTWVALFTAAFSFWRIKTSSPVNVISISNCQSNSTPEPEAHFRRRIPPPPSPVILEDEVGLTKGKFVVYYEDDGEREMARLRLESEKELPVAEEWEYGGGNGEWWESFGFERVLKMRMEDLGWYRYQDLTAINGHVVRLWDGVEL